MNTPTWRKSSRSDSSGNECVELARLTESVGLRDSKTPQSEHLCLAHQDFRNLVQQLKARS
ncbi:DUF397 domain-containing protein [Actinomadura harenae]|uniref:DUF397 domain-containing protein n=1 Tax=Actinomadura harenae TaxID=2483351 RepID=A0A3M2LVC6_9ACTN|nr:DUF397 domain-containing protein [Actinomadura harenae]RMI40503.1 DUF397 domain-containing protein [Actinomadura harenae]